MIRIRKNPVPPPGLVAAGGPARQALEARYDANPVAARAPRNRPTAVSATIYNAPAVKAQLIADQHEKCCYCEALLLHVGYGDVEHYRPKNGFRQTSASALEKPGYYWLAYDWHNLLFACSCCNSGHKRNLFPLANHPAGRARSHHDALAPEQPLLLHPAAADPAPHLTFRRAVAVGTTPQGRATIAACGLNRPRTLERRRTHLAHLESHEDLAGLEIATLSLAELRQRSARYASLAEFARRIRQARLVFEAAAHDTAEYAGLVRANFPHLPQ